MRFLLAIHDVWPGNFPLVAGYLARLRSLGARRIALLAVPAYHGAPPMDRDAEFIAWLREEAMRGTELFLHGHRHLMGELRGGELRGGGTDEGDPRDIATPGRAPDLPRRNAWGRFVNRSLVEREAEFCGLPRAERARLFAAGMEVWKRTGLPLSGFVAPTWHGAPPREEMRAAGIPLWETRFRLVHLPTGRSAFVPPLAWGRSRATGEITLAGGRAWRAALMRMPLLKVALHPGDLESEGAERVVAGMFPAGVNVGYAEIFGGPRDASQPA
jgi:predicted deacetylase